MFEAYSSMETTIRDILRSFTDFHCCSRHEGVKLIAGRVSPGIQSCCLLSEVLNPAVPCICVCACCVFCYNSQPLHAALKTEHTWIKGEEGEKKVHIPVHKHTEIFSKPPFVTLRN